MSIIFYLLLHIFLALPYLLKQFVFLNDNEGIILRRISGYFWTQMNADILIFVVLIFLLLLINTFVFKSTSIKNALKESFRTAEKVLWPLIVLKIFGFIILHYHGFEFWLWNIPLNARYALFDGQSISYTRFVIKVILNYLPSFLFLLFLLNIVSAQKMSFNIKIFLKVLILPLILVFTIALIDAVNSAEKSLPFAVGDPFPRGELPYLNNLEAEKFNFDALKRKVVLIDFWASWCWPCRKELPILKELRAELASKDMIFLGVNREPRSILQAQKTWLEHQMNFDSLLDYRGMTKSGLGETLKFESLPTLYILDRNSEIVHIHIGLTKKEDLKAELENLLREEL